MILCTRCDTWCYSLTEHQDNGECELVQLVRESQHESFMHNENLEDKICRLEEENQILKDEIESLELRLNVEENKPITRLLPIASRIRWNV
jgi:hypothetical protein